MDALTNISESIRGLGNEHLQGGPFWNYEPWDVEKRPQAVIDQARIDGVDIASPQMTAIFGEAPRPFQSGVHLDVSEEQLFLGPTKGGKTRAVQVELVIQASHMVPISMQHDKGVDTGIPRDITPENIERWGRWKDGQFLDKNIKAREDGTWNCGNIIGIGKYPEEKFAPPGEKFWVLTTKEALDEKWWDDFKLSSKRFFPKGVVDESRGNMGFNEVDRTIFLVGQRELHMLTYEMGDVQFEATDVVWWLVYDEEPYKESMWIAGLTHSRRRTMILTPYNGITWSKKLFKTTETRRCYHATAYDSPYLPERKIKVWRDSFASWDVQARIWAVYTEQRGKPYFHRELILKWMRNETPFKKYAIISTDRKWREIRELLAVEAQLFPAVEPDEQTVWEIYEDPIENEPYLISIDTSGGSVTPEGAADRQCAYVTRKPTQREGLDPVMVASCVSTLEPEPFSRVILPGARWYNNTCLAPEMGNRGASNAAFMACIKDWPWFIKMAVRNDVTKIVAEKPGVDMNWAVRQQIFDYLIRDYITRRTEQPSGIPHELLLRELAACQVGKNGRPDHPRDGTLDCVISWGISLYVWKNAASQVTCNVAKRDKVTDKTVASLMQRLAQENQQSEVSNIFSFSH